MATPNNSIIPITSHILSGTQEQCVDARDLHTFLEVGRDFTTWIKDRISEYGFVVEQDFIICSPNSGSKKRGGANRVDYILSLEMAKELAMVEKNEKGREARRYFIACERSSKQLNQHPDFVSIHKSALDTGACIVTPNNYGSVSALPINPDAIALLPALSTFIDAAKRSGFLLVKPDQLVQKLLA